MLCLLIRMISRMYVEWKGESKFEKNVIYLQSTGWEGEN